MTEEGVYVYDENSASWVRMTNEIAVYGSIGGGGALSLDDLTDVDLGVSPISDADLALVYDAANERWVRGTIESGGGGNGGGGDAEIILRAAPGTATIENGQTSVVVEHELPNVPARGEIQVTPNGGLGAATTWWISGISSTEFTIHVGTDPGEDIDFDWLWVGSQVGFPSTPERFDALREAGTLEFEGSFGGDLGWRFQPVQDLRSESFRVYLPSARTTEVRLWRGSTLVREEEVTASADTWQQELWTAPVDLDEGQTYHLVVEFAGASYYRSNETGDPPDGWEFDTLIGYDTGTFATSSGSAPSNTANRVYGIVDLNFYVPPNV